MTLPSPVRSRIPGDFGQVWISQSIDASKPDNVRNVLRLFERQSRALKRRNAYKAMVARMAMRFAKGVL